MKMILGVSALLMATSAVAQPKYLHCNVGDNSFDVTADEAQSSIIFGWHDDGAIAAKGSFDAKSIFWTNDHHELLVGTPVEMETFGIDRTTLAIKNVKLKVDGTFETVVGKCVIQKPVKRAI